MTDSAANSKADSTSPDYAPTSSANDPRALASLGAWTRFLVPASLGLAVDLWVKYYAFPLGVNGPVGQVGRHPSLILTDDGFVSNPPQELIPHTLAFTTTVNHGAVFGIGQGMVFYFLIFSLFAMALIIWVFVTSKRNQWLVHIALGMITAGALGNLYDRALFGGVRDMLRFQVDWYPYIFNIADVLLCVGVPLLMLCWIFGSSAKKSPAA